MLDETSAEPLHHQLQKIFIRKIESGEWPPGEQLEGELVLSNRYGISRSTVRQALLSLVNQQYLRRKQGKGTFVSTRKHDMNVLDLRFTALADSRHEPLSVDRITEAGAEAAMLGIPAGAAVTCIRRLRYIGSDPVALESSYLAETLLPGIRETDLSLPLLDILRQDAGISIVQYQATLEPVVIEASDARTLDYTDDPALGMMLTRIGSDSEGNTVVVGKTTFRGDRCRAIFNH